MRTTRQHIARQKTFETRICLFQSDGFGALQGELPLGGWHEGLHDISEGAVDDNINSSQEVDLSAQYWHIDFMSLAIATNFLISFPSKLTTHISRTTRRNHSSAESFKVMARIQLALDVLHVVHGVDPIFLL